MPQSVEKIGYNIMNRNQNPVEIRNGVALFDGGAELAMRQIEIRANTAIETEAEDGKKTRTVEVVWTTGASVLRYCWRECEIYEESLEVSDNAVRLDRMNKGASVLNSHWGYDLEDVLGIVEESRIENGMGISRIRLSNRASVDDIWGDIVDGIIRHVSVGYHVHAWEINRKEGEMTTKRAVDWEPFEISFVAIPADSGSSVRSENGNGSSVKTRMEGKMPQSNENDAPAEGVNNDTNRSNSSKANEAEIANERSRQKDIRHYADVHGVDNKVRDAALDEGVSFTDFVRANVDSVADASKDANITTVRTNASVTNQRSPQREMHLRGEAFTAATLHRIGMKAPEISDEAREFANEGMRGIAEACIRNTGGTIRQGASDREVVAQAFASRSYGGVHSTGDIQEVLGQPVRAVLENRYEDSIAETDYQEWTGATTTRDFKVNKAVHVGLFTGIRDLAEGEQPSLARLGAGARYFQLSTRGLKISFTREMIINDEFGVLLQSVGKLGMIYRHDEQQIAVRALVAGTMKTGNGEEQIFNAVYQNIVEGPALDQELMKKAKLALRSQKLGDEFGNFRLGIRPSQLIVSSELEDDALRLVAPITPDSRENVNPNAGRFSVRVVDDLPEGTAYIAGQGGLSDVIQVARLEGAQGPQIQRVNSESILSAEWETLNDFTAFGAGRYGIVKINVRG